MISRGKSNQEKPKKGEDNFEQKIRLHSKKGKASLKNKNKK
jgi:hypothetical protein